jgi:hypothetical protein
MLLDADAVERGWRIDRSQGPSGRNDIQEISFTEDVRIGLSSNLRKFRYKPFCGKRTGAELAALV